MRRPAALMPPFAARLAGFCLLGAVAALEWQRMVDATSAGRALVWVLAAGVAAALLRLARGRAPAVRAGALAGGTALAVGASGLPLELLRPARWGELGEGLARGAEALAGSRLPYGGTDPWPGETLELAGAVLVLAAAYAACWPRRGRPGRPVASLVLLLTVLAVPITAMAVPAPLPLGIGIAAGAAALLFLDRLPLRPGYGMAALAAAAMALALPIGAAADRDEPWFDYRSFAEQLGPVQPIRFQWNHGYGPIDWPRDGREVFRVVSEKPFYWKAESLAGFDGERWVSVAGGDPDGDEPGAEVAPAAVGREEWTHRVEVVLRRLRTDTFVGPGTILDVDASGRELGARWTTGRWVAPRGLGSGDSYTVEAHVPQASPAELRASLAGWTGRQSEALRLRLPYRGRGPGHVEVEFPAFGLDREPWRHSPWAHGPHDGTADLRRTAYRRTWRLSRRLRRGAESAWDYALRINAHLRSSPFRYTEQPPVPASGVAPLDHFLHDSRAGYCQQFSGAMALLLRMGGVPARVATGFTPGGFRKRRGEWIVRDVDAHSWVEAWFDDVGWVTLDPTPPATPARSQIAAIAPPRDDDPAGSAAGAAGEEPAAPAARRPEGPRAEPASPAATAGEDGGLPLGLLLGGLALAGGAGVAAQRRRTRGNRRTADGQLAELERALRRSGRPPATGVTLAELERRLGGSPYVRALRTARYGAGAPPPTAAERAAFRRDLAAGLGWTGWLRALWAVPPRWR